MLTDRELQGLRNMGNEAEAAADEIDRLRSLLDRRPAINAGIVEAYIAWSNDVYASGLAKSPADTAH